MAKRNAENGLKLLLSAKQQQILFGEQVETALRCWLEHPEMEMGNVLIHLGLIEDLSDIESIQSASWDSNTKTDHPSLQSLQSLELAMESPDATAPAGAASTDVEEYLATLRPIEERYIQLEFISRGGSSDVYQGFDTELERKVALKILREDRGGHSRATAIFLNEARVTATLEHPNIPGIYGIGRKTDGRPCIAMELLSPRTLLDAISDFHQSGSRFRNREFSRLIEALGLVCRAGRHAHAKGIVHRDIKPANIFLGTSGEIHLGDWGLSVEIGDENSVENRDHQPSYASENTISGTLPYICPERILDRRARSVKSDVYSAGVTMYQLLTGQLPFSGDFATVCQSILDGRFTTPRKLNRKIPPLLEAVCLKAMATDPQERYGSIADLEQDLESWRSGQPLIAADPPATRLARFVQSNLKAITAGFLVTSIAMLSLLFITEQNRRQVTNAKSIADTERNRAIQSIEESQDVVDTFLIETSRGPAALAGIPGSQTLRKRLLTKARDYYAAFVKENADLVPPERVANAHAHLALVLVELGELDVAEKETLAEQTILREQIKRQPSHADLKNRLAAAFHRITRISTLLGDFEKARQHALQAIQLRESMGTGPETKHFDSLCAHRTVLANSLQSLGRLTEAKQVFGDLCDEMAGVPMDRRSFEFDSILSMALQNYGVVAAKLGDNETAERIFIQSEQQLKKLVSARPQDSKIVHTLGMAQHNLGQFFFTNQKPERARDLFTRADVTLNMLIERNPGAMEYLATYLHNRYALALSFWNRRETVMATQHADAVIEIARSSINSRARNTVMAMAHARAHLLKAAITRTDQKPELAVSNTIKAIEILQTQLSHPGQPGRAEHLLASAILAVFELKSGSESEFLIEFMGDVNRWILASRRYRVLKKLGEAPVNRLARFSSNVALRSKAIDRLDELNELYTSAWVAMQESEFRIRAWKASEKAVIQVVFERQFAQLAERIDKQTTELNGLASVVTTEEHQRLELRWAETLAFCDNGYAWELATASEIHQRDGHRAVKLATLACEQSAWKNPKYLDTLAAAHAETDNFAEAVRILEDAIELADENLRQAIADRLALYRSGKKYRQNQTVNDLSTSPSSPGSRGRGHRHRNGSHSE